MQLALFEPLDLKDVGPRGGFQRPDRGIEVAVFLQHARKLGPEFPFFLRCHLALRFHRPLAALEAAQNPSKYRALRLRHQGHEIAPVGCYLRGFAAAHTESSVDLP